MILNEQKHCIRHTMIYVYSKEKSEHYFLKLMILHCGIHQGSQHRGKSESSPKFRRHIFGDIGEWRNDGSHRVQRWVLHHRVRIRVGMECVEKAKNVTRKLLGFQDEWVCEFFAPDRKWRVSYVSVCGQLCLVRICWWLLHTSKIKYHVSKTNLTFYIVIPVLCFARSMERLIVNSHTHAQIYKECLAWVWITHCLFLKPFKGNLVWSSMWKGDV